jgi:hypothetical protein
MIEWHGTTPTKLSPHQRELHDVPLYCCPPTVADAEVRVIGFILRVSAIFGAFASGFFLGAKHHG